MEADKVRLNGTLKAMKETAKDQIRMQGDSESRQRSQGKELRSAYHEYEVLISKCHSILEARNGTGSTTGNGPASLSSSSSASSSSSSSDGTPAKKKAKTVGVRDECEHHNDTTLVYHHKRYSRTQAGGKAEPAAAAAAVAPAPSEAAAAAGAGVVAETGASTEPGGKEDRR